jgi:hypothetical protein
MEPQKNSSMGIYPDDGVWAFGIMVNRSFTDITLVCVGRMGIDLWISYLSGIKA